MRTVIIVCPRCKELAPVVDKQIAEHGDCEAGGMRYLPSPRVMQSGPGAPKIEIVAVGRPMHRHCDGCGAEHEVTPALAKVTSPDPQNN